MSYDLVLIQRFEAVYRRASFSRAADELGVTHSAMTKSIRTLEDLWGVRLFERTTRSVVATTAGRRLGELAPELLAHAADGMAQVRSAGRQLSVACGPAIIDSFLPAALLTFRSQYPDATIEAEILPPDLAVERLLQRRTHLLLYHSDSIAAFGARRDLRVRHVREEPYYLLCTRNHPALDEPDFDGLLRHDWAIAGFDRNFAANQHAQYREVARRAGFPRYRLSSQQACIELARSGAALTMLPRSAALTVCAANGMEAREISGLPGMKLSAMTLADADDAQVDILISGFMVSDACAVGGSFDQS